MQLGGFIIRPATMSLGALLILGILLASSLLGPMSPVDKWIVPSSTEVKEENFPPNIAVPDFPYVPQNVLMMFVVTASDPDSDPLRFTWLWGDGVVSVTAGPSAVHAYTLRRTYALTVYADDLTGLQDHNVSDTGYVVIGGYPHAPEVVSFNATPVTVELGDPIAFAAVVVDFDGGVLRLTYDYGGGVYDVWNSASTLPGEQVTHSETHTFATLGFKTVFVSVLDSTGMNTTVSSGITVSVVAPNAEPVVSPLDPISSYTGAMLTFVGDAHDPDNLVLRYTWDFGDGSALKVGQSVSYAYLRPGTFTVTLMVDDLTSLTGHNVSTVTSARIAFRLNLLEGWNLVSLPMVTTYKASTLGLDPGDQVIRWNSLTQSYQTHIVGMPLNDFDILLSDGYWIYAASAKTLTLHGEVPKIPQSVYIQVPASGGWALVGLSIWYTVGVKAHDLLSMFDPPTVMVVVRFDQTIGVYRTHVIGLPINDFALVNGEGYWVFLSGSSWFTLPA